MEKKQKVVRKKTEDFEALKQEFDQKTAEHVNHLQRIQADFENYIKRTDKEREHLLAHANQTIITELLTIMDEFEQALKSMQAHKVHDDVYKGQEMLYKNLQKVLAKHGVKPIKSIGEKVDPYKHEVILTEPKEDVEEGTILEEIQKGYQMNDVVVRYAKVKVAKSGGNEKMEFVHSQICDICKKSKNKEHDDHCTCSQNDSQNNQTHEAGTSHQL